MGYYNDRIEDEKAKCEKLIKKWLDETLISSNINTIINNKNFLEIIEIGEIAIPYILQSIIKEPSFLFIAINKITDEDPVKSEHVGRIEEMVGDWIEWGKKKGYI